MSLLVGLILFKRSCTLTFGFFVHTTIPDMYWQKYRAPSELMLRRNLVTSMELEERHVN